MAAAALRYRCSRCRCSSRCSSSSISTSTTTTSSRCEELLLLLLAVEAMLEEPFHRVIHLETFMNIYNIYIMYIYNVYIYMNIYTI
jgi:hypothetical protein